MYDTGKNIYCSNYPGVGTDGPNTGYLLRKSVDTPPLVSVSNIPLRDDRFIVRTQHKHLSQSTATEEEGEGEGNWQRVAKS